MDPYQNTPFSADAYNAYDDYDMFVDSALVDEYAQAYPQVYAQVANAVQSMHPQMVSDQAVEQAVDQIYSQLGTYDINAAVPAVSMNRGHRPPHHHSYQRPHRRPPYRPGRPSYFGPRDWIKWLLLSQLWNNNPYPPYRLY